MQRRKSSLLFPCDWETGATYAPQKSNFYHCQSSRHRQKRDEASQSQDGQEKNCCGRKNEIKQDGESNSEDVIYNWTLCTAKIPTSHVSLQPG
jgi:hypothetical protein